MLQQAWLRRASQVGKLCCNILPKWLAAVAAAATAAVASAAAAAAAAASAACCLSRACLLRRLPPYPPSTLHPLSSAFLLPSNFYNLPSILFWRAHGNKARPKTRAHAYDLPSTTHCKARPKARAHAYDLPSTTHCKARPEARAHAYHLPTSRVHAHDLPTTCLLLPAACHLPTACPRPAYDLHAAL